MILCVDVNYHEDYAVAAGIVFRDWNDEKILQEIVEKVTNIEPYISGQFYRRELPCIIQVLSQVDDSVDTVIIDGYVWLNDGKPGLGAHLYRALHERVSVIGVAKKRFFQSNSAMELKRGQSNLPLFVTAAGMNLSEAISAIKNLQGAHRIPRLLKKVDTLCRMN
jgi:deoxyribonuclease V